MYFLIGLLFTSMAFATPSPTPSPSASPTVNHSPVPPTLRFTAGAPGSPPMAISPNPLTITQNGESTTYNLWVVTAVTAGGPGTSASSVPLTVTFQLMDAQGDVAPLAPVQYSIPNIVADGNLKKGIAVFFQELSTEAFQMGKIQ